MANYSLTINPYQARSFDDVLKPYAMISEAYKETLELYDTIEAASDMLDKLINTERDPETRKLYDSFMKDLHSITNDLLKNGLSSKSKRILKQLRSRYNKDITAILNAVTARAERMKELRGLLAQDDSLQYENDILGSGNAASLDRYMEDPNYGYGKLYSPRKAASALEKKLQIEYTMMRLAEAWAMSEMSHYVNGMIKCPHKVANAYINMRNAGQLKEAYDYLRENYPFRKEFLMSSGIDDSDYSNQFAGGGYMDEEQLLVPHIMTIAAPSEGGMGLIDFTAGASKSGSKSSGSSSKKASKPATKPATSASPTKSLSSSPSVNSSIPSTAAAARAKRESTGTSRTDRTGGNKSEKKERKSNPYTDKQFMLQMIQPHTLFAHNLDGTNNLNVLNYILEIMGISPDLITDYGDPIKAGEDTYKEKRRNGEVVKYDKNRLADGVGRESYQGRASFYPDKWSYYLEEAGPLTQTVGRAMGYNVKKVDFWSLFNSDFLKQSNEGGPIPSTADGKKIQLFSSNGFLGTLDSILKLLVPYKAYSLVSNMSVGHPSYQEIRHQKLWEDRIKRLYGAILKFFVDNIHSRDMGDGSKGYHIDDFFDYVDQTKKKNGPLGMNFWELAFTLDRLPRILSDILYNAGFNSQGEHGKDAADMGVFAEYNIFPLLGWTKDGNPILSEKRATRDDFYAEGSTKDGNSKYTLKDEKAKIMFSENPKMNGLVLYFNGRYYYVQLEETSNLYKANSLSMSLANMLDLKRQWENHLAEEFDKKLEEESGKDNSPLKDLKKGTKEYAEALELYRLQDELYLDLVDSIWDIEDTRIKYAMDALNYRIDYLDTKAKREVPDLDTSFDDSNLYFNKLKLFNEAMKNYLEENDL